MQTISELKDKIKLVKSNLPKCNNVYVKININFQLKHIEKVVKQMEDKMSSINNKLDEFTRDIV